MKNWILSIAILGTASVVGLAGADTPTAVTCGDTISSAGEYVLAADCVGNGITIAANDVTLGLGGHTLTNNQPPGPPPPPGMPPMCFPGDGVRVNGVSNVQIVGPGTITGFLQGVAMSGTSGSRIQGLSATNNCFFGIVMGQGSGNDVRDVDVSNNVVGLQDSFSANDHLVGVTANNNADRGIALSAVSSVKIEGSTANGNRLGGIAFSNNSSGNQVHGNSAQGNGVDLSDESPSCGSANWTGNQFTTANQSCIQ